VVPNEIIIKDTHRGLWYEDGVLTRVVEAGRYVLPGPRLFGRVPQVDPDRAGPGVPDRVGQRLGHHVPVGV